VKISYKVIVAIGLTLTIVASLWFAGPAEAYTIDITQPSPTTLGKVISFYVNVTIEDGELLPIDGINLTIYNKSDPSRNATCNNLPLATGTKNYTTGGGVVNIVATASNWMYGYGYGYASWGGYGYHFFAPYGYGYGYGSGPASISYYVSWHSPSGWPAGKYVASVETKANGETFTKTKEFTLTKPSVAPPGGGPGGGPGVCYYLEIDIFGSQSDWLISEDGILQEVVVASFHGVTIQLGKGTTCLDKDGNRLAGIRINEETELPPVPENRCIIGEPYDLQPDGATFTPPLELAIGYDNVPQNVSEEDIYIAYYDATTENWVPLTSQVDTQNNIVTAAASHFTTFAIMGEVIPPPPAKFTVTSLDLSSEQVEPGQEVLVTVNVTNIGGSEGSYTLNLTINGIVEQTKTVTLAPSASDTVTFAVIKEEPGSYTISVDGLTKEFSVAAVAPSWLSRYWWTILIGLVVVGLLLFYFKWWRPREAI